MSITDTSKMYPIGAQVRHYKGGMYFIHGYCTIEATMQIGVLYRPVPTAVPVNPCDASVNRIWLRPADNFYDIVDTEHGPKPRFERVEISTQ